MKTRKRGHGEWGLVFAASVLLLVVQLIHWDIQKPSIQHGLLPGNPVDPVETVAVVHAPGHRYDDMVLSCQHGTMGLSASLAKEFYGKFKNGQQARAVWALVPDGNGNPKGYHLANLVPPSSQ